MIMNNAKESTTIYQTSDNDMDIPEAALIVNCYKDNVSVDGTNGFILLNRATIPELIKVLKQYQKYIPE